MKATKKVLLFAICCGVVLLVTNSTLSQDRGDRVTSAPNVSLEPVALVNASIDGVARALVSPTGVSLNSGFTVPRGGSKTIEVLTSGGSGDVGFSHTLPLGVPPGAFEWEQTRVPVPRARGRLRYNGCQSCPASFTIQIRVASGVFSATGPLTLTLTDSVGKPEITSISRSGGTEVVPRYEVNFAQGTFNLADSEAIGVYAGNLKYRLIPETNNATATRIYLTIPRLKASRTVSVILRNAYGSSSPRDVELPSQELESGPPPFTCINCSTVFGEAPIYDEYSVKHNSGVLGDSGTDAITIKTLQSGTTPCNEPDVLYHAALVRWIDDNGSSTNSADKGTVSIASQPPVDQPLRAPQNIIRIAWSLKALKGEQWYQVLFGSIKVVGVCSNRVVQ